MGAFVSALATSSIDESTFPSHDIISTGVAIIGGGASGTYAAVRLREDFNVSVLVVEPQDRLGGHANTYVDPATGTAIDYGVQAYVPYGNATAFFSRFNISMAPYVPPSGIPINVNAANGRVLTDYTSPTLNETFAALAKWANLTAQYTPFMLPGLWNFPAPSDIPADLLLPIGAFARKYNIVAALPTIMSITNVGVGGVEDVLTLWVMQQEPQPTVQNLLDGGTLIPKGESNSYLYTCALQLLAEDVLLQSWVTAAERYANGVKLVVQNAAGGKKLIKAKRLLFTASPSLTNLAPFDLDSDETAIFGSWSYNWWYPTVARIPGMPENYSITYVSPSAAPANPLAVRDWPWTLSINSAGPPGEHLFRVWLAANYSISGPEAQELMASSVQQLLSSGTLPGQTDGTGMEFLAYSDHSSIIQWGQTATQLKEGFVQKLYSLQGRRNTWYTGALWTASDSTVIWAFTDTVLPKVVEGLNDESLVSQRPVHG